ncbi:MAG: glycerophosphodiester phosphodiesterase family protein [Hyphomicrobiaceae bacterium]
MRKLPFELGPVAHRGLHDAARGILENTTSSVAAALAKGYRIEVDVQESATGEPVVFHDEELDRLMEAKGLVKALTPPELKRLAYKGSRDTIMTLDELLEMIAGRQPLFLEVKTMFTPPGDYERRIAASVQRYKGPVAVMGFDPWSTLAIKAAAPGLPYGIISYRWDDGWMPQLSSGQRFVLRQLLLARRLRADFIAYDIDDLPAFPPLALKRLFGVPLLTWTVRTPEQQAKARRYADAPIFEGFEP